MGDREDEWEEQGYCGEARRKGEEKIKKGMHNSLEDVIVDEKNISEKKSGKKNKLWTRRSEKEKKN